MPKLSKKAKAEAYDALDRQCSIYRHYAHLLANGESPQAEETIQRIDEDGYEDVYSYQLYDCLQSWGGLLVIVSNIAGNRRKWVDVHVFDDYDAEARAMPLGIGMNTDIRNAVDRLRAARRAIFDRESHAAF